MLDKIIQDGIAKIYKEDLVTQKHYINTILEEARNVSLDVVYKAQGFFVPNDRYMVEYFGSSILGKDYDCFNSEGLCIWTGYIVFPIRDVLDRIVGFVGYNPFIAIENKEKGIWDRPYYRHSSKNVMNKSLYMFSLPGTYNKALKEGYMIITDGVFDMLSSQEEGLIASALLGSYVPDELAAQLFFIDRIIVAMDNDDAGLKVVNQLKKVLPQTVALKQGKYKDIDDLLKSTYKDKALKKIKENIKSGNDITLRF